MDTKDIEALVDAVREFPEMYDAAPDLLAACRAALSAMECNPRFRENAPTIDALRAAIAKAAGESQKSTARRLIGPFSMDLVSSESDDSGHRLYIDVDGRGAIGILANDDGVSVDLHSMSPHANEPVASCWATTAELGPGDDDDLS